MRSRAPDLPSRCGVEVHAPLGRTEQHGGLCPTDRKRGRRRAVQARGGRPRGLRPRRLRRRALLHLHRSAPPFGRRSPPLSNAVSRRCDLSQGPALRCSRRGDPEGRILWAHLRRVLDDLRRRARVLEALACRRSRCPARLPDLPAPRAEGVRCRVRSRRGGLCGGARLCGPVARVATHLHAAVRRRASVQGRVVRDPGRIRRGVLRVSSSSRRPASTGRESAAHRS